MSSTEEREARLNYGQSGNAGLELPLPGQPANLKQGLDPFMAASHMDMTMVPQVGM